MQMFVTQGPYLDDSIQYTSTFVHRAFSKKREEYVYKNESTKERSSQYDTQNHEFQSLLTTLTARL